MANQRVAIVGCGPSGISVLSAFNQAEERGETIPEIICFDKQDIVGGQWNFAWQTGTDMHGERCHHSMYRYLFSNGPKEVLEYSDYSFREHFGKPIPSFPPRPVLRDYIAGKAKKNNIERFIRFGTIVRNVEHKDGKFVIRTQNLRSKEDQVESFDYLIVASGHFSVPYMPTIDGMDDFNGRRLHSHDFRDARDFLGKKLLILGNHYSGEDIAMQCAKYGVQEITLSYKSKSTGYKWPKGIREIGECVAVKDGLFHFKDGSTDTFDVVIFATGYQYHFDYLPRELRLSDKTKNRVFIDHLYKGCIFNENPKVIFMGMHDQYYSYQMFDAQAWFTRDCILGKIDMKTEDEREMNIKEWRDRFHTAVNIHDDIDFQRDYISDLLLKCPDYPEKDNKARADMLHQWQRDREENIATYRDKSYVSTITGDVGPLPLVPWFDNLDDSLEGYINTA